MQNILANVFSLFLEDLIQDMNVHSRVTMIYNIERLQRRRKLQSSVGGSITGTFSIIKYTNLLSVVHLESIKAVKWKYPFLVGVVYFDDRSVTKQDNPQKLSKSACVSVIQVTGP